MFPEELCLSFWQVVVPFAVVVGVLLFCMMRLADRMDEMTASLRVVEEALETLRPLAEESRRVRARRYEQELEDILAEEKAQK